MNVLEMIKRVLDFQDWKEASSLPGWRPRPTRTKKSRTPFAGREKHFAASHMTIEEYRDKGERDRRFADLRAKGTPHVSKFSVSRGKLEGDVWCVVRP